MRIHRYRGRENGLMIIGSKEELSELGHALAVASPKNTGVDPKIWPPEVAVFTPLSANREFKVSFHIATTVEIPETNFPDRTDSGGKTGIIARITHWWKN